jgi:hypothetical protein
MQLEQLSKNLWIHTQPFALQGVEIGTRSSLVAFAPGELLLIGPGPETRVEAQTILALGQVKHIIAPNAFHHLYLAEAKHLFPEAMLWAPGAVAKKQPQLALSRLQPQTVFPWASQVEALGLQGTRLQEYVFYHKESHSLVLTDLLFNVLAPQGIKAHVLTAIMGTRGKLACSRLVKLAIQDKAAFKSSLQTILAWDFKRIIMAHGVCVEENARTRFTEALAFVLE